MLLSSNDAPLTTPLSQFLNQAHTLRKRDGSEPERSGHGKKNNELQAGKEGDKAHLAGANDIIK